MRQTNLHQRWRNTRGDKIMKILDTLKSANSNLARNKVRTTLTIIAIFVGAFTLALTTGINTGVNRYIDAQLGSITDSVSGKIKSLRDEQRAVIDSMEEALERYKETQDAIIERTTYDMI